MSWLGVGERNRGKQKIGKRRKREKRFNKKKKKKRKKNSAAFSFQKELAFIFLELARVVLR